VRAANRSRLYASSVIFLLFSLPAAAVIKVEMPVSKMYGIAQAVVTGSIASVNPDKRVIEVKVTDTLKGESPGNKFRIQIVSPVELIKEAFVGQPVVLLTGKARNGPAHVLHIADTWLLAERVSDSNPPIWRVVKVHDAKKIFPGTTAALVRIMIELKAGKSTLLDKMEQNYLSGGIKELGRLKAVKPSWLMAVDVNGDKKPDLLVGVGNGVKLFMAVGAGYKDVTEIWGLSAASGSYHAVGDVYGNGRIDLLLDNALWMNDRGKFTDPSWRLSLPVKPLAAALIDFGGHKKLDAAFLTADGILHISENPPTTGASWKARPSKTLWKDDPSPVMAAFGDWGDNGRPHVLAVRETGVTRYALDGGRAADFERLTGVNLQKYYARYSKGLKNAKAVAIDINGDGRRDLMIVCEGGGLLMVNRGFGAFLVDYDAGVKIIADDRNHVPFKLGPNTVWAAADMRGDGCEDLLVLTEDGILYDVANPRQAVSKQKNSEGVTF
jgi:hypothetical protein